MNVSDNELKKGVNYLNRREGEMKDNRCITQNDKLFVSLCKISFSGGVDWSGLILYENLRILKLGSNKFI